MPSAAMHSHYWTGPARAATTTTGGYSAWQGSVVCGGGFGVMQVVWEWAIRQSQTAWPLPRKG